MGHEYVKENDVFSTDQNGVVPKPTASDIENNHVLKADHTWGAGGGGSGEVVDVKVNGDSVLDENNEAQIISYKEVTQSEYNALPDSKLTDGVLYCIKDAPGSSDGFPPLIYSDEEREIGVWRDGKPLYQKSYVYENSSGSAGGSSGATFDVWNLGSDKIIISGGLQCTFVNLVSNKMYPLPYADSSFTNVYVDNGVVKLRVRSDDWGSNYKLYMTARYTKTTDTPGSGTWGVQGSLYKVLKIASYSLTPSLVQSKKNLIKTFTVPYVGYYNIGIREVYNRNTNRSWLEGDITSEKGVFLDTDSYQYTDVRYDVSGYTQFVRSIPMYISDITAEISFYLWGNGYSPNSVKIVVNKIG